MKKKHLLVQLPEELHKKLKIMAAERNITMRLYLIRALLEKIKKDESYS